MAHRGLLRRKDADFPVALCLPLPIQIEPFATIRIKLSGRYVVRSFSSVCFCLLYGGQSLRGYFSLHPVVSVLPRLLARGNPAGRGRRTGAPAAPVLSPEDIERILAARAAVLRQAG